MPLKNISSSGFQNQLFTWMNNLIKGRAVSEHLRKTIYLTTAQKEHSSIFNL